MLLQLLKVCYNLRISGQDERFNNLQSVKVLLPSSAPLFRNARYRLFLLFLFYLKNLVTRHSDTALQLVNNWHSTNFQGCLTSS